MTRKFRHATGALLLAILAMGMPALAQASWTEFVDFSGYIESDIRYIVEDYRGATPGDGYAFEKNQNDLVLRFKIFPNDNVQIATETKFRFYGFHTAGSLPELVDRPNLDPYHIQLDEAYVYVRGLIWDKLDLKVGRFAVNWGTADQFNPTSNLSAPDFSDPLDYTSKVPNQFIQFSMYPVEWFNLTLVWAPTFKPAQVPYTAVLGFAVELDEQGCLVSAPTPPIGERHKAEELQELFEAAGVCNLNFGTPHVRAPKYKYTFANSQFGARSQFSIEQAALEFSFSYYYGRFSFPIALSAVAEVNPSQTDPNMMDVAYIADLIYPRMQVAGFDFSHSASWLFDLGIVGEVAVIFPEKVVFGLRAIQGGTTVAEMESVNVPSTPFVKATAGLDYTFTNWLYMNVMYVRGFFDEFNDLYGVHNYVVMASELSFFQSELKIRLAATLNADDTSAILLPQVTWTVYPSVELIAGGLVFIGNTTAQDPLDYASKSKFGQKSYGRTVAFLKAKASW